MKPGTYNCRCFLCDNIKNYRICLHEIWNAQHRQLSIKYNLQIPVCIECHCRVHGKRDFIANYKRKYQLLICEKLNIDFYKINIILNISSKYWNLKHMEYMLEIKNHMENFLNDWIKGGN